MMNIKSIALLASTLLTTGALLAQDKPAQSCGAGSCSKKATKQASCSKKDGGCSKKESACSKKDSGCAKKDGSSGSK